MRHGAVRMGRFHLVFVRKGKEPLNHVECLGKKLRFEIMAGKYNATMTVARMGELGDCMMILFSPRAPLEYRASFNDGNVHTHGHIVEAKS